MTCLRCLNYHITSLFLKRINPPLSPCHCLVKQSRGCLQKPSEPGAAMPSRPCSPSGLASWKRSGTWLWYAAHTHMHQPNKLYDSVVLFGFLQTYMHANTEANFLAGLCPSNRPSIPLSLEGFPCARVASRSNQKNHEAGWGRQGKKTFSHQCTTLRKLVWEN